MWVWSLWYILLVTYVILFVKQYIICYLVNICLYRLTIHRHGGYTCVTHHRNLEHAVNFASLSRLT